MHIRAVIFDLDGTLIDSYRDIGIHLNRTLRDFGLEGVDVEKVRHMVGGGARELLKRFFPNGLLEEALKVFRKYYLEEPVIHTRAFDGIERVLKEARERRIALAVATNKMEELSRLILKRLGLYDYFSVVVGGDTFSEKKPSPLPLIEVLKRLGIPAEEALMVGDTEADLTAGRLAGMKRALAKWGYVRVEKETADYELESPEELISLFEKP